MLDRERHEVAVGIMFFVVLAGLIGGLFWGKRYVPQSSRMSIQVAFPSVGGLREGDAVLVAGLRMGKVEEIILRESDVLVTLTLNRHITIRRDYHVEIAALNLTGEMGISVNMGAATPLDAPLPVLRGTPPFSINSIVGPGLELMQSAKTISETLLVVLPQLSRRTNTTLDHIDTVLTLMTSDTRTTLGEFSLALSELRQTLGLASTTMNDVTGRLNTTLNRADTTFTSLTATSDTLRILMSRVDTVNSTAARLMRDSTLHTDAHRAILHLDTAAVNLDSLIRDINRNPKRYIGISIF